MAQKPEKPDFAQESRNASYLLQHIAKDFQRGWLWPENMFLFISLRLPNRGSLGPLINCQV